MDITEQMNWIGGDVNLAYEAKLELAAKDAALEAAKEAILTIRPHLYEKGMAGETEYERAALNLWEVLSAIQKVKP
jgi:hypothetical protein